MITGSSGHLPTVDQDTIERSRVMYWGILDEIDRIENELSIRGHSEMERAELQRELRRVKTDLAELREKLSKARDAAGESYLLKEVERHRPRREVVYPGITRGGTSRPVARLDEVRSAVDQRVPNYVSKSRWSYGGGGTETQYRREPSVARTNGFMKQRTQDLPSRGGLGVEMTEHVNMIVDRVERTKEDVTVLGMIEEIVNVSVVAAIQAGAMLAANMVAVGFKFFLFPRTSDELDVPGGIDKIDAAVGPRISRSEVT